MKSIYALILTSFAICFAQESIIDKNIHFLKQPYESFKQDIRLIQKCYVEKKSICNEKEQKKAQVALRQMGVRTAALFLMLTGLYAGYKKLSQPKQYKEKAREISDDETAFLVRLQRLDIKLRALVSENEKFKEDCENYRKKNKLNDLDIQSLIAETYERRQKRKGILKTTFNKIKQEFASSPFKTPEIQQYIRQLDDMIVQIEQQLKQIHNYVIYL